jgi:menaquinone-specific isochorismate synthase
MQSKPPIFNLLQAGCILSNGPNDLWIGWEDSPCRNSTPLPGKLNVFAPDFFLKDSKPWWSFKNYQKISRSELLQGILTETLSQLDAPKALWTGPDLEKFHAEFSDLKGHLDSKKLMKAVPVVFQKTELPMDWKMRGQFLSSLLRSTQNLPLFVYGVWSSQEGILGASPEILFEVSSQGSLIRTAALAGTRLKSELSDPTRLPLLSDPKELQEHEFVIRGIEKSMENLGRVEIGKTQELELPTLSHLYTPIQIHLSQTLSFTEVATRLHPTPALGAFPKEEGRKWLASQSEAQSRGRFGAPFGFSFESGESRCVVAIRNLQWSGSHLQLGAGCGVVQASEFQREWQELLGKIKSVKKLFEMEL